MKQSSMLLGLVLAVGAFAADPPAAANPLDGKVFQSVEKLTGGERRDGSVTKTHWKIRFKERSFELRHTDVVSSGTYAFDAKTGAITIKDSKSRRPSTRRRAS
jgi:hypothetical protein